LTGKWFRLIDRGLANRIRFHTVPGLEVLMTGRRDIGTGFVYYDTLEATGLVWMNRQTRPVEPSAGAGIDDTHRITW
jgi:hypothetical protein